MPACLLFLLAASAPALNADADVKSPYRGQEAREIKALSPQDVDALLAGEGMGFAKAAELNGWPGPKHVLELADELGLDDAQLAATGAIEEEMRAAAIAAGRRLVEAERALDRRFASRTVTPESLEASLATIATLRGELRRVHLDAHLRQSWVLTPAQVRRYAALRGYEGKDHAGGDHHP